MDQTQTGKLWDLGCSVSGISEGSMMGAFGLEAKNIVKVKLTSAEANHAFQSK